MEGALACCLCAVPVLLLLPLGVLELELEVEFELELELLGLLLLAFMDCGEEVGADDGWDPVEGGNFSKSEPAPVPLLSASLLSASLFSWR
jgi:hypothetical protein